MKKEIILFATMATVSIAAADSLSEALSGGAVLGDIASTYESKNTKKDLDSWNRDSAYSVGSVGLSYESAKFHNFSASLGFRGYETLWEDKDDDISNWFDPNTSAIVKNAYLAYDSDTLHVKLGRQALATEWFLYDYDAISAEVSLFEKAELELIFSKKMGNASSRDLVLFNKFNDNKGVYKAGFKYTFNDIINSKIYAVIAPKVHDIYGLRADVYTSINGIEYGGFAHYMQINEDNLANGTMIDAQVYIGVNGWYSYIGYTSSNEAAMGRASYINGVYVGDTVVQLEEGDQMYLTIGDNETMYAMLYKNFSGLDLTVIYGTTDYDYGTISRYSKSELDIWAGYSFYKKLKMNLGFMQTYEDDNDAGTTNTRQVNATLTYMF